MLFTLNASVAACLVLLSIDCASAKGKTVTIEKVVTQTIKIPPVTEVKTIYATEEVTPPPFKKVVYATQTKKVPAETVYKTEFVYETMTPPPEYKKVFVTKTEKAPAQTLYKTEYKYETKTPPPEYKKVFVTKTEKAPAKTMYKTEVIYTTITPPPEYQKVKVTKTKVAPAITKKAVKTEYVTLKPEIVYKTKVQTETVKPPIVTKKKYRTVTVEEKKGYPTPQAIAPVVSEPQPATSAGQPEGGAADLPEMLAQLALGGTPSAPTERTQAPAAPEVPAGIAPPTPEQPAEMLGTQPRPAGALPEAQTPPVAPGVPEMPVANAVGQGRTGYAATEVLHGETTGAATEPEARPRPIFHRARR